MCGQAPARRGLRAAETPERSPLPRGRRQEGSARRHGSSESADRLVLRGPWRKVASLAARPRDHSAPPGRKDPSSTRDRFIRTHAARRAPIRFAISAAAALVNVRQRIVSGAAPESSSRSTRPVSTCVLPGTRRRRQRRMRAWIGSTRLIALKVMKRLDAVGHQQAAFIEGAPRRQVWPTVIRTIRGARSS